MLPNVFDAGTKSFGREQPPVKPDFRATAGCMGQSTLWPVQTGARSLLGTLCSGVDRRLSSPSGSLAAGVACQVGQEGKASALGGSGGHLGCRWQLRPPHLPGREGLVRGARLGTAWLPSSSPVGSLHHLPLAPASQERCKDEAWPRLSPALCLPLALLRQPLVSLPSGPAFTLLFAPKPALLAKSLLPTNTQALC